MAESIRSFRMRSSEQPRTTTTSCFVEKQNTMVVSKTIRRNDADTDMVVDVYVIYIDAKKYSIFYSFSVGTPRINAIMYIHIP